MRNDKPARDIEDLLKWAYVDELSKRFTSTAVSGSSWDQIYNYGTRGGMAIDQSSPQRYDLGEIDPMALRIEAEASALPKVVIDWDRSKEALVGELAGWMSQRDVLLIGSINVAALVIMHAQMANRPDWHREPPRVAFVPSPKDGKRPHVEGKCEGKNRYSRGSHCPLRLIPSAYQIALHRADYAAWHHGLCMLAERLDAAPPSAPAQPWITGERARRIHLVGKST